MYVSHGHIDLIMTLSKHNLWAWTRSLLGLCAQEIHICGEASAIDLVKELRLDTGDEVEVGLPHIYVSPGHIDLIMTLSKPNLSEP
jgi:hypothetical protein